MSPHKGTVWVHPTTKSTLATYDPRDRTFFVYVGAADAATAGLLLMALEEGLKQAAQPVAAGPGGQPSPAAPNGKDTAC